MGIATREYQLHRWEETLVENLLLIGDELSHAVSDFHRTTFELDNPDSNAVQVSHQVGPPLVAAAQGHFLSDGEMIVLRVLPIDQLHLIVRLSSSDLHRHAIAQQLVGAQIRWIKIDTRGICGSQQLLKCGRNVCLGIAPLQQVRPQQINFNASIVFSLVPIAEIVVAKAIRSRLVREQGNDAVLCLALGAESVAHVNPSLV